MWFRTATASPSASIADRPRAIAWRAGILAACLALGSPAAAAPKLSDVRGHISIGYGKLFAEVAPGGSITFAGGVEVPVRPHWTAGVEIGNWLLGSRLLESGSVSGELDYSVFEASALARWQSERRPVQVYLGPSVFHGRADLTSSAPASFEGEAIEETVGGFALGAVLIRTRPSPVRAGLELATREMWLPNHVPASQSSPKTLGVRMPTWSLVTLRLTIHY
ncbi:MAG: hypothetical protein E6K80_10775 [Candidatus Eisenbacteria bacterium]|uniref:Outer membrane protein beta-barrel domain-containing protein n=1 Tax=Eiseniibacteriota bacterium TaxID=2212470 RepID=A0A538U1I9_UNCEI|nr:MAG: hypothetical protein E6K80_10775 [Candidatus Eisenbacteria bacterium]